MSEDEIDKMEAGPELDQLIAVEVTRIAVRHEGDLVWNPDVQSKHLSPPAYSADIAAAWEVLQTLDGNWELFPLHDEETLKATAYFFSYWCERRQQQFACYEAVTAPLAICRVALKAAFTNPHHNPVAVIPNDPKLSQPAPSGMGSI